MPRPTSFDHVLSKGNDGMPRSTSFVSCVLPNRNDDMPQQTSFD